MFVCYIDDYTQNVEMPIHFNDIRSIYSTYVKQPSDSANKCLPEQ